MKASDIPTKIPVPWATNATSSYKREIPQTTSDPVAASFSLGWPPDTATPTEAGGTPPDVRDANGIQNLITLWERWYNAGAPVAFDSVFATAIGGYPAGAIIHSAVTFGRQFLSTADDNVNDPDAGGAGWRVWPINQFYDDAGTANALSISVFPVPVTLADLRGVTIGVAIANTTTSATPTLRVRTAPTPLQATIINADGSPIQSKQLIAGRIAQFVFDGTFFQVQSPSLSLSLNPSELVAPGPGNYVVPNYATRLKITQWGAGGGGGGSGGAGSPGGGGGSGAACVWWRIVTPGEVIAYNVGAIGVHGNPGAAGTAGGNTVFGDCTTTGGGGGDQLGNGGAHGTVIPPTIGVIEQSIYPGNQGGRGIPAGSGIGGQGGGAYCSPGANGTNSTPEDAVLPGSGGAGGGGSGAGSDGANGLIIVEPYR